MTQDELVTAVSVAIGDPSSSGKAVAKNMINLAVYKLGRTRGVPFNQSWETITLTAGTSSYKLGVDLIKDRPAKSLQEFWRTDAPDWPISIVQVDEFNAYARGGLASGAPRIATVYNVAGQPTLEVYPSPDQAYSCKALARLKVTLLGQIPEEYHDVVYAIAINLFNIGKNAATALQLAALGLGDIKNDTYTGWTGGAIDSRNHLISTGGGASADSTNLRP